MNEISELTKAFKAGLEAAEHPPTWTTKAELFNWLGTIKRLSSQPNIRGRTIRVRGDCKLQPRHGWPCFQHWATNVITAVLQAREGTKNEQSEAAEYLREQKPHLDLLRNGLWEELERIEERPTDEDDRPLTMPSLIELVVGRANRVGKIIAKRSSTVYSWKDRRASNGFPDPLTWQSARAWLMKTHDFDIGNEPPEG